MNRTYFKIIVVLLLLLVGNVKAQDSRNCDGFATNDAQNLSVPTSKLIRDNQIKKSPKEKLIKSKSNYLGSFKLLIPHNPTNH